MGPQLTVVKLTVVRVTLQATEREVTLQLHHTEEKLTLQPLHTEEKLTHQLQATVVKLTEVTPTEERTTEINHTDTKHDVQIDYFAALFQDHQTSQKNFKIDYCIFIFICVFDTFNKLH